jgi:hypothetical protein
MNPFLKSSNRFSALIEEGEEQQPIRKEKTNFEYDSSRNTFLNPKPKPTQHHQHRTSQYYSGNSFQKKSYIVEPIEEVVIDHSVDVDCFVPLGGSTIVNVHAIPQTEFSFANKLKAEVVCAKEKDTDTKRTIFVERATKGDTPNDTLNKLCDLYAYQERWGRYWYGNEAYDEMYGIQSTKQYTNDQNEPDEDYDSE